MKLVAFDTGCSRDYNNFCEMCLFGFVIANENFEIETSEYMFIKANKPTGRLRNIVRVDSKKLSIAPDYGVVRKIISQIFGLEDVVFIAHSPENNFRHLCIMDRRYGISPIKCKAYDVLVLLRNYVNIPLYSLSDIAGTFGIKFDHSESNHRAKTCIRIVEYICKEERISLKQFIEVCGRGALVDSEIVNHRVLIAFKQKRMELFYSGKMVAKNGKFSNMKFAMSESFENENIEVGFRIGEYVTHNGGIMTKRSSEANVFIWDGNATSKRLGPIYSMNHIKVIKPSELFTIDVAAFSLDCSQ
ncbi:MAG: hypothetical protein MJY54_01715 [archaeon]|nr:hypothetical protein [archaeon]